MKVLPARLRRALPLRPERRFGVVFAGRSAQLVASSRTYDPAAVFGAHRPPAPAVEFDDTTVVSTPWWLA